MAKNRLENNRSLQFNTLFFAKNIKGHVSKVIYDNRGAFFALFLGSSFSCFGVFVFVFWDLRFSLLGSSFSSLPLSTT